MKFTAAVIALVAFFCGPCFAAAPPNIVYFLVDDMGYADCGFNGGKDILTPNIDNGRSTPGAKQANDAAIQIRKKADKTAKE